MRDTFHRLAGQTTALAGSPLATGVAFAVVGLWLVGGTVAFGFGTDYQMWINTGTTIVTFLMVFLIQAAQNREARAMQLKLDELLSAVTAARTSLVALEERPETDLEALHAEMLRRQRAAAEGTR